MSFCSVHFFLEGIGLSYVHINWLISCPLNITLFLLYDNQNYYCVSGHFVFSLNDWPVCFHHSRILCSKQFLECSLYTIVFWCVCDSLFIEVHNLLWLDIFICPYTFSLVRYYMHRKWVLWVWSRSLFFLCDFLYTWYWVLFIQTSEYLHGFCQICIFPFFTLNVTNHYGPLGFCVVRLAYVYFMVFCVSNYNFLLRLSLRMSNNIFPLFDVCNMSKLLEWTNDLGIFFIERFNWDFVLIVLYVLLRMRSHVCTASALNIFWYVSIQLII